VAKLEILTVYRRNDGSECVVNSDFDANTYTCDAPKKRGRKPLRSAPLNPDDAHKFDKLG
jgi:hypothetical protein